MPHKFTDRDKREVSTNSRLGQKIGWDRTKRVSVVRKSSKKEGGNG